MKVSELSKQLNITNKELITFLKENNCKISSHNQNVPENMIDVCIKKLAVKSEKEDPVKEVEPLKKETKSLSQEYKTKTFKADDLIPCRSVTPWKLQALSIDKTRVYYWGGYGHVEDVTYRDLQALRRTDYITKPKIIIEDPDLCYQWRRELGDTYKYFLNVEYPEEFFDKNDEEFRKLLTSSLDVIKEVIKVTAINMIRNENYPSIQKLNIVDEVLGTCLKDFI